MKMTYLLFGLLIGGVISFFLTKSAYQANSLTSSESLNQSDLNKLPRRSKWNWSDTLDAVQAASKSHRVVYEDSTVRILQVVLEANKTEPVHTHQWKSVMWFTQATPMRYYKYGVANSKLVVQGSIPIAQMPAEVLNQGAAVDAEEPHAIRNLSKQAGMAYRVEFKKEFAP